MLLALVALLSCNEAFDIAAPTLDESVFSCDSDTDCVAVAGLCARTAFCQGGFCVIEPKEPLACYSGPSGTEGIGACVAGVSTCDPATGEYGMCNDEALPSTEDCEPDGIDNDCDGQINEDGPSCSCGDGFVSTGELCDDGNGEDGDACTNACLPGRCGDGELQPEDGEQCEDGNASGADACSALCQHQEVLMVTAGGGHTCALLTAGKVKCWGKNEHGELGLGDTAPRGALPEDMGANLPAVDLGEPAVLITAGLCHTCALLESGAVKCWGCNDRGQLGLGDKEPRGVAPSELGAALLAVDLGGPAAKTVVAGVDHTCALLSDGSVKCWGHNEHGELGIGDNVDRGTKEGQMGEALPAVDLGSGAEVTALALGNQHTCALLSTGKVKCWGQNHVGQLGLGDSADRGKSTGQMGDALPAIDLGLEAEVVTLASGYHFNCAILLSGKTKCWGRNAFGQLGIGKVDDRGNSADEMGDALPVIDLGTDKIAVQLAAGDTFACALLNDESLKCWGGATFGQLGLGDIASRGDGPNEMGDNLPALALGTGKVPAGVTADLARACAVLADKSAKCWGANPMGALGIGAAGPRGDNPDEMGDALPIVRLYSEEW